MPLMEKARHDLVEFGKRLVTANLTKGTGGNLSVFDRENGTVAITQASTSLRFVLRISSLST